jgi:DNA repair exonuclease SbcCD ATPase subunit
MTEQTHSSTETGESGDETIKEMITRLTDEKIKSCREIEIRESYIRELEERIKQRRAKIKQKIQKMKQEGENFNEETTNMSGSVNLKERVKQMMNCKDEIKGKFQQNCKKIKIRESLDREMEEKIKQSVTRVRQKLQEMKLGFVNSHKENVQEFRDLEEKKLTTRTLKPKN